MAKRDIPEINAGSMADIAFLLLIFFLVTTTMDRDTAYIRSIPKKIDVVEKQPPVEKRNIFAIKANSQNQLMVRNELMDDPDDISERILEFYRTNEELNDPSNNFPMYSTINMAGIEENITRAESEYEAVENDDQVTEEMKDFKLKQLGEWENKKSALKLSGRSELREIHVQAHIRIEVQKETAYELFAKIQSEIEEALYELRDDAAVSIFGESYGVITKRYDSIESDSNKAAQAREDKAKIDLLKILYPDRIIEVTPK